MGKTIMNMKKHGPCARPLLLGWLLLAAMAMQAQPQGKPFVGLSYSPFTGNQSPNGIYPTVAQMTGDFVATNGIVALANEISTYGMEGSLSNIPAICNTYGVKCYPCAYLSTNDFADDTNQLNALIAVGNANYGTTMGLVVGSEAILQGYDPQTLISNINYVRAATRTNIPVGTREIPANLLNNPAVVSNSDFVMADIYAYWSQIPITNAVAWTIQQWQSITNAFPREKVMIGEANWPTGGTNTLWNNLGIVPSVANQSQFLIDFVSMVNSNNIEYFIFEYRDEPWKIQEGVGTVEQNWGILDANNNDKQSLVDYLSTLPNELGFTDTTNADDTLTIIAYTGTGRVVTIPTNINGLEVTGIGTNAFYGNSNLASVTISGSVTNVGTKAFYGCTNLTGVYFQGNAPSADCTVFQSDNLTVYYYSENTGWGSTFACVPAVMLNAPNPVGSLQVTITPAGAITDGALWQVDGRTSQISGATVTNLSAGTHTVSFTSIPGWNTPAARTVTIIAGATTTAIGLYKVVATGVLSVVLLPAAVSAEAQWEVINQNLGVSITNLASGVNVTNLAPDNYTVSFTSISGWNTPPNQTVTITSGVTTTASGIYTSSNWPPDNLILITNGSGTIQHAAWPKSLVTGKKYKVTAVPKAKNVFVNWVGGTNQPYSILTNSAGYTFTMQSNLLLEANFVTNVFLAAQGAYKGLFAPTGSARQQTNSGSFSFNVTSSGAVSGNLDLGGQTVPFSGKFNLGGTANILSKPIHGIPSLTTTLQLDFADQSVSGTVIGGAFLAELNGYQDVFSSSDKATGFEGQYTLIIPGTTNPTVGPFGTSYGTVKVSSSGNITLAGSLADGTAISQSSVVSQDGYWPLYVNLYGGKGSLWGWNYFTNQTITAPSGISWINSTNSCKTTVCRSGFTNQQATLAGGLYLPGQALPSELTVTLEDTNFSLTISNLSENTNKLTLKMNKTTGVISGSFANPENPKQTIKVNGVILQGQTNAQGYFLGTNQSGTFTLEPQ
jgi:exo-beta-1,3-glucanase (GH17 family)